MDTKINGKAIPLGKPDSLQTQKITTEDIHSYINILKRNAKENGDKSLILKSKDIHKDMNLKNRFPMVCNAMRQCMLSGDEILYETASGYSSTLEIKYFL